MSVSIMLVQLFQQYRSNRWPCIWWGCTIAQLHIMELWKFTRKPDLSTFVNFTLSYSKHGINQSCFCNFNLSLIFPHIRPELAITNWCDSWHAQDCHRYKISMFINPESFLIIIVLSKTKYFSWIKLDQIGLARSARWLLMWDKITGDMGRTLS